MLANAYNPSTLRKGVRMGVEAGGYKFEVYILLL